MNINKQADKKGRQRKVKWIKVWGDKIKQYKIRYDNVD